MTVRASIARGALAAFALTGAACASAPREAAALATVDPQTVSALKSALGEALGRARIELGPIGEGGRTVTVLPPPPGPYEDRSQAMPVVFDLFIADGRCYARRRGAADRDIALAGVACRPVAD